MHSHRKVMSRVTSLPVVTAPPSFQNRLRKFGWRVQQSHPAHLARLHGRGGMFNATKGRAAVQKNHLQRKDDTPPVFQTRGTPSDAPPPAQGPRSQVQNQAEVVGIFEGVCVFLRHVPDPHCAAGESLLLGKSQSRSQRQDPFLHAATFVGAEVIPKGLSMAQTLVVC